MTLQASGTLPAWHPLVHASSCPRPQLGVRPLPTTELPPTGPQPTTELQPAAPPVAHSGCPPAGPRRQPAAPPATRQSPNVGHCTAAGCPRLQPAAPPVGRRGCRRSVPPRRHPQSVPWPKMLSHRWYRTDRANALIARPFRLVDSFSYRIVASERRCSAATSLASAACHKLASEFSRTAVTAGRAAGKRW
jgi:hypothetical protein